jgi:hypothetical protein
MGDAQCRSCIHSAGLGHARTAAYGSGQAMLLRGLKVRPDLEAKAVKTCAMQCVPF